MEIEKVEPFRITKLTDVIDEEVLQMIQTGLSEWEGVPLIILEKREGKWYRIGPIMSTLNYCEFCDYLRGDLYSKIDMECVRWDCKKADEIMKKGNHEPQWYSCHMRLIDIIFPIVIGGEIVAVFFSGQKRLEGRDNEVKERIREISSEYKYYNSGKMMKLFKKIKPSTESDIKAFMDTLAPMVGHITSLGESNFVVKKRLHEKEFLKELSSYFGYKDKTDISLLWDRLERVLQRVIEFKDTTKVAMFLISEHEEPGALSCKVVAGLPKDSIPRLRGFKIENLETGAPVRLDLSADKQSLPQNIAGSLKKLIYYLVPITAEPGLDGILAFGIAEEIDSVDVKFDFLAEVASLISTHIQAAYFQVVQHQHIRELEAMNREIEEFMTKMAHSLRAPMQSILSEAGFLDHRYKNMYRQDEKVLESVNKIIEEVGILKNKLDNSLLSSYMERMEIGYNLRKNSLVSLIEGCVNQFRNIAKREHGIGIIVQVDGIPDFEFDWDKMDIVFTNLFDNAIKYSHRGKDIYIRGTMGGNEARISIEDFGLGIREVEKGKISKKYYRGELKDRRRFIPSTGVGLTVARRIVEDHGGRIDVDSHPAAGIHLDLDRVKAGEAFITTFTVSLPLVRKERD